VVENARPAAAAPKRARWLDRQSPLQTRPVSR